MRIYQEEQRLRLEKVCCNRCGRELTIRNGHLMEGCLEASPSFGYFSEKDGLTYHFDLCEACFDTLLEEFAIPPQIAENCEYL